MMRAGPAPFLSWLSLVPRRAAIAACLALLAGCEQQDMLVQPKYETYQESEFFANGQSARPLVQGTVARGQLRIDKAYYAGKSGDKLIDTIPLIDALPKDGRQDSVRKVLVRGQDRYNIYCSPCHGRVGDGQGMIVKRGFSAPPSFHDARLRDAPSGHYFDVITNGYGAMYSYASRVSPDDRWKIVAYIRALQLSQHATLDDVPAEVRARLEKAAP